MSTFNFKNREEYLIWVESWKNEYWQLSHEIRQAKADKKQFLWKRRPKDDKTSKKNTKIGPNPLYGKRTWKDPSVASLKEKASAMLTERQEAKTEAKLRRENVMV